MVAAAKDKEEILEGQRGMLVQQLQKCGWLQRTPLYESCVKEILNFREVAGAPLSVIMTISNYNPEVRRNIQLVSAERNLNYQFILVDIGGVVEDVERLSSLVDKCVRLTRKTAPCLARNIGSTFADGPILLFLEADGAPRPWHDPGTPEGV